MGFGDQDVDDFWGHSSGSAFLCSPMVSLYSAWKTQKVMFLSFLPPAQGKAHKQAFSCFYRVVTKGAGWGVGRFSHFFICQMEIKTTSASKDFCDA